jgi:hypothetical protein
MTDRCGGGLAEQEAAEDPIPQPAAINAPTLAVIGPNAAGQARLVSLRAVAAGAVVAAIERYRITTTPSYRSVQIAEGRHIEDIGLLAYLNHSCAPNVHIDCERLAVVALRDIPALDELTFFYPSTEWDMAQPFQCWCGSDACLGTVNGARHLPAAILAGYRLAPHVQRLAGIRGAA